MPLQMSSKPASFKLLLLKLSSARLLFSNFRASPIPLQLNTVRPQWYILPKTHVNWTCIHACWQDEGDAFLRSHSLQLCKLRYITFLKEFNGAFVSDHVDAQIQHFQVGGVLLQS